MTVAADIVSAKAASSGAAVMSALKRAGDATGASFDFLYKMARRESSLDPTAEAKTSSAAGLFQFIEQTWLGAVKKYGARHGLGQIAAEIETGPNGRHVVADAARRKEILDLRFDPAKAAALAGELAQENRAALEQRLGRPVGETEMYAAHFLGASGAAKLLSAPANARAADLLPAAAAANRNVFYGASGARTVGEVVASIEASMAGRAAAASARALPAPPALRSGPSVFDSGVAPLAPAAAPPVRMAAVSRPAYVPPPFEPRAADRTASGEDAMRLLELFGERRYGATLTPLAVAVLQSLDPTGLGAMRPSRTDQRES